MMRFTAAVVALAAGLSIASPGSAQTPAAGDIGLGKRLYQDKATCGFCHGWSGDGAGDPQSPGKAANLRETKLDHDQLVEVILLWRPRRHGNAAFRQVRLDQGRGVLRDDCRGSR